MRTFLTRRFWLCALPAYWLTPGIIFWLTGSSCDC